jgi:uncharacterized protein YndB with AHSA1/START domain
MTTMTIAPYQQTFTVDATVERAFDVFTNGLDSWWPRAHRIGSSELVKAVLEPRTGGRWYEVGVDGSECNWGSVLAWEPPTRLVLAWQLNGRFEYDPDSAHASEVEINFTALGPDRTEVSLEHRHLDRLADAHALAKGIAGKGGWPMLVDLYVAEVNNTGAAS